ncbi:hypothetical protein HG535_0H01780 [Zygotorulaspora mrakii]|uniref:STAS domain-containing protein n=1 Tax=Zygotorulaspora mrakii TaxID=42260 RepID=A0A7H9B7Y0_ZYGMR|nr:uncharacterized protein HG535_0H01780 [Zygotorulaspora mrakii]QLG74851.1 hypothetical protein HG535_0H01780 [Zygotorulaspora mrakii]
MPYNSSPLLMRDDSGGRSYLKRKSSSSQRGRRSEVQSPIKGRSSSLSHEPSSSSAAVMPNLNSKTVDAAFVDLSPSFWDLLPYYLPCFSWIPNYTWIKFGGDLVAGISLASFQIPLALSYATSVAHVEPLCGLYSLAFTPFVYAIFGSVPQMIVGPESAISLVVGQAVEKLSSHNSEISVMDISVVLTFISGSFLFIFGLCRFGFLGNVLSRALLRGFISSVGLVMIVNALINELKLNKLLKQSEGHFHTPFKKVMFILKYGPKNYHKPTAILSLTCFVILMMLRIIKKKLMKRHRWPVFVPEILILIIVTIFLSARLDLKHAYGISVIGDFNTRGLDSVQNPLSKSNIELIQPLMGSGFSVAMLGFFESTTASKSLGSAYDLAISPNRELVALGSMNLFVSIFGGLPSFGGYGRSKINAFSGAQTVMSGVFMGAIVLLTVKFLLSFIHYIPVCILSVVTTIVGISLLEEVPADLRFHFGCRGYGELAIFAITVLATIFYSVEMGICIGCGFSVITIIKHATKSRIQIMARIKHTSQFVNPDDFLAKSRLNYGSVFKELEEFEGCLVVRIPEPLTFTNTEDLKERLNRMERFGSVKAHPAAKGKRTKEGTRYVLFDMDGLTFIDSSAAQIMLEIVASYKKRGVKVFLSRVPFNDEIRARLESSGVTKYVQETSLPSTESCDVDTKFSPYFASIEEALSSIDECELTSATSEYSSEQSSLLSATLINSNLV